MSALVVINAGHHVTTQDLGRPNASHYGLTQGGAADWHAHCWGQKLLGNPMTATSLEIVLGRVKFRANQDLTLVLTGADCLAEVHSPQHIVAKQVQSWRPFSLKKGQELHLKVPRSGCRSYLSVSGGFAIEPFLGSTSTVERDGVGGLNPGQPLACGDSLVVNPNLSGDLSNLKPQTIPRSAIPNYDGFRTVHLLPCFQFQQFDSALRERLLNQIYTVSAQSNRMGIRLKSSDSETARLTQTLPSLISEGILSGSVQIPPDGNPIIMLSDHQTLGGYQKLGVVAFRDLAKAAQLRPGEQLRFKLSTLPLERLKQQAFYRYFDL
ncbi:biotin-dependent carboxyltransferase family protein [Vibrio variabilis]|uniref:5-oxoprolinase subunit C family protein n=1 Tax=Vibrio variabilis TaxID=990271 RepID=UPI000DD51208|nr:biotin-dependent carboxyltransferase family protein [Vibrio variabilis]